MAMRYEIHGNDGMTSTVLNRRTQGVLLTRIQEHEDGVQEFSLTQQPTEGYDLLNIISRRQSLH